MSARFVNAVGMSTAAALLGGCGGSHASPFGVPVASSVSSPASVAGRVLYSFAGGNDGSFPQSAPIVVNGTLYGTTPYGGGGSCSGYLPGCGIVYVIDTSGSERVLHAFKGGKDGDAPNGSLARVNGALVGTTERGGNAGCKEGPHAGCGTVFEITTTGSEHILFRFPGKKLGALPISGLTSLHGALYGSTAAGGTGNCSYSDVAGCGVIFKILGLHTPTISYAFKGGESGRTPEGPLLFDKGTLYGTTLTGGRNGCVYSPGCGTAYALSPSEKETTLHEFAGLHGGSLPQSGMVTLDGALYGTASEGGPHNCSLYGYHGCGTIFRITPSGKFQSLYAFTGGSDGAHPNGLIVVGNKLYGTTLSGVAGYGCGTVFEMSPEGRVTTIYSLNGSGACDVTSAPVYANHRLYGTTEFGGTYDDGTVFEITL